MKEVNPLRMFLVLMTCLILGCDAPPPDRQEPTAESNPAPANGKDPREELHTAIAAALRQLQNKEYERFVADFMSPAEKQKLTGLKITDIGEALLPLTDDLIAQLQGAQGMLPQLEDDGTRARFSNVNSDGRDLVFEKTGKYWYIQGATPEPMSPK